MSITYNANRTALVIGSNEVTYSITSTYTQGLLNNSYYKINDGASLLLEFPITVNEGDKLYCAFNTHGYKPIVTMNGSAITVEFNEPEAYYFTIQSVIGDVEISNGTEY